MTATTNHTTTTNIGPLSGYTSAIPPEEAETLPPGPDLAVLLSRLTSTPGTSSTSDTSGSAASGTPRTSPTHGTPKALLWDLVVLLLWGGVWEPGPAPAVRAAVG